MVSDMNEAPDIPKAIEALTVGAYGAAVVAAGVFLAIAIILMPIYVMVISSRMRQLMHIQKQQLAELKSLRLTVGRNQT